MNSSLVCLLLVSNYEFGLLWMIRYLKRIDDAVREANELSQGKVSHNVQ